MAVIPCTDQRLRPRHTYVRKASNDLTPTPNVESDARSPQEAVRGRVRGRVPPGQRAAAVLPLSPWARFDAGGGQVVLGLLHQGQRPD